MKYEAVFGDQSLFDGAPDDAEMVGGLSDKCRLFYKIVGGDLCASFGKHDDFTKEQTTKAENIKVAAMRRIIAEPKRWTMEDKKAGRLPEVGAEYNVDGCIVGHLGNGAAGYQNILYFKYPSGACGNAHERLAKPIETPDEKAARLRDEWSARACELFARSSEDAAFDFIYDALLSGELSAPVKVKDGD